MTTEQVIFRKTCKTETQKELKLEYALTCTFEEAQPQYGVLVRAIGQQTHEQVCVPNITPDIMRAASLLRLLSDSTVTPCTAKDVIDDWL